MSDEQTTQEPHPTELEREQRRLARLRLVTTERWPVVERYEDEDPGPQQAA
jgi:hypothetical protein